MGESPNTLVNPGFYVVGYGGSPKKDFNFHISPVVEMAHPLSNDGKKTDWFVSQKVTKAFPTSWGQLVIAGDSLWKWEEVK